MRILVISDIHANLNALNAVLKHAGKVDEIWCLGDVIGYGPDPNECVQRLRELPNFKSVLGNHDAAVLGKIPLTSFNVDARLSIQWTKSTLAAENLAWLETIVEERTTARASLVHGSPRNPIWEYLLDPQTATLAFDYFETKFCFVGHTHLPIAFLYVSLTHPARWVIPQPGELLIPKSRVIINPGSVGQPRDHDPRASYGIFDDENQTWLAQRVEYDIESVQKRIYAAALPERHALRLTEGW
jgi:predicted phosphodiesterase